MSKTAAIEAFKAATRFSLTEKDMASLCLLFADQAGVEKKVADLEAES